MANRIKMSDMCLLRAPEGENKGNFGKNYVQNKQLKFFKSD